MADLIPDDIATTLLRALTWSSDQITSTQRYEAWAWVDANNHQEEMGR